MKSRGLEEQWQRLRRVSPDPAPMPPAAGGAMPAMKAGPMPCPHGGEGKPLAPEGK